MVPVVALAGEVLLLEVLVNGWMPMTWRGGRDSSHHCSH